MGFEGFTSDGRAPRPGHDRPVRIALMVEEGGGDWHARRLVAAFAARGATVVVTTLKACGFDTTAPSGIAIPGFADRLPDAIFVRSVSQGSLEQITLRLGILHALRALGLTVWNEARVIERCVDKSTATFLFHKAGLPTPRTHVAEGRLDAERYLAKRDTPLVLKPLFGSQGNGVRLIRTADDLPPEADIGSVYYLQDFVPPSSEWFEDRRVLVCAGRVLSTMIRRSRTWITNVHQGAEPHACTPDAETRDLALAAAAAVGADYAGVDLIRLADGRLAVLEINSNPAWKGLQSVTAFDIAEELASAFLAAVAAPAALSS